MGAMLKHRSTPAMFLAVAGLLSASSARAAETIAIMDFTASGASASEAAAISGFVRSAVVRSATYTVVEKKNMDKILQEQAFQQTGCTSQDCAVKLGKMLNVKKMIVGEYTMLGGVRFLTASLVDVESSQIERSGKVKGFEVGNADDAADQLVAQLEGKAVPAAQQPVQQVITPAYTQPQPAWTPPPAQPARRGKGYLTLYLGGASGTLKKFTEKAEYESSAPYSFEGDSTETVEIDEIAAESGGPSFGLRIGSQAGAFAFDVELSMTKLVTPAQSVPMFITDDDYYYGTSNRTSTANLQDEFLIMNIMSFMFNIYGVCNSDGKFQPYIGGGFGLDYYAVESAQLVDVNTNRPLDTGTMAFGLQLPLGFKIWTSEKFYFWAEWHPAIHIMVLPIAADKINYGGDDFDWNTTVSQFSGGIGFGF